MKNNCLLYIFIILVGTIFILYNNKTKMMEGFTLPRNKNTNMYCKDRTTKNQCTNGVYDPNGSWCSWDSKYNKCVDQGNNNTTSTTGIIRI